MYTSYKKKGLIFFVDFLASVCRIPKLVKVPIIAMTTHKSADKIKFLLVMSVIKEAKKVPKIVAKHVSDTRAPLALDTLSDGTISGIIPYLEGPNIALCDPIKNNNI